MMRWSSGWRVTPKQNGRIRHGLPVPTHEQGRRDTSRAARIAGRTCGD